MKSFTQHREWAWQERKSSVHSKRKPQQQTLVYARPSDVVYRWAMFFHKQMMMVRKIKFLRRWFSINILSSYNGLILSNRRRIEDICKPPFSDLIPTWIKDGTHELWRELGLESEDLDSRSSSGTDPCGHGQGESPTSPRFPSVKWTHLRSGALTPLPVQQPGLCGSNLMEKLTAWLYAMRMWQCDGHTIRKLQIRNPLRECMLHLSSEEPVFQFKQLSELM